MLRSIHHHVTQIYVKRDLQQTLVYNLHLHYMHFVINAVAKETYICQKRPAKETCVQPAFALYAFCHKCCGQYIILSDICQKRPLYVKRDLQQTPVYNLHLHYVHFVINAAVNIHDHVTQIYVKRHSYMSKETYKRVLSSCHTDD